MPQHVTIGHYHEIRFTLDEIKELLCRRYGIEPDAYAWGWLQIPDSEPLPPDGRLKLIAMQRKDNHAKA